MSALLFAQFMPNAGPAIIVSVCLALLAIVGFFFITYFAHCFLTVVIDSAAGIDEIRWPSEWVHDWLTKPVYLIWVLVPLLLLSSMVLAFTSDSLASGVTLLILLWLAAPVLYLSTLAAKSWLALLYGPFLKRWARFLFAYLILLVWSALLTGLGVGLLVWSMWSLGGVALAALFLPPLCLLYWRVVGRYAWYVTTRRMRKPKKKLSNPTKGLKVESLDPWGSSPSEATESLGERAAAGDPEETAASLADLTELRDKFTPVVERDKLAAAERDKVAPAEEPTAVEEDEWTPNKKPYVVMTETKARESWVERRGTAAQDNERYDVEKLTIGQPISLFGYYSEREKKEEELREQGKSVRQFERPRKPPTLWQAMTQEIVGFLFYPHSLRAWINLAILFAVILGVFRIVVETTEVIKNS